MEESKKREFERELLTQDFEELVVNLLRAVGSEDPRTPCMKVVGLMEKVLNASKDDPDFGSFGWLVTRSISEIRKNIDDESRDDHVTARVARKGLTYLSEAACSDSAADGRAAKRRREFREWAREIAR